MTRRLSEALARWRAFRYLCRKWPAASRRALVVLLVGYRTLPALLRFARRLRVLLDDGVGPMSRQMGWDAPCCEHSDLGPMSTGVDGSVIAGAARCQDCGVLVMVTVDVEAHDA